MSRGRPESVGQENYRTHKFINYRITAESYDDAMQEANKHLSQIQTTLKDLYVLHLTLHQDTTRRKNQNTYCFQCNIYGRSVRGENNRFKHLRQREIHELNTFAKGFYVGCVIGSK